LKTTLVVDASVVVQACLEAAGFDPLAKHTLIGPQLVLSEALSALHEGAFRGELTKELARAATERLKVAPVEVVRPEGLAAAAWEIADALGWAKTYDAEYVALARLLDRPLLTVDARLARGAGHVVSVVGPADIPA
jgi:predicted nucleic acid-binding protein